MTQITPNLNLTVWNNISDPYDSGELVDNFVKLDVHDHSGRGKGVKLDASQSIVAGSITGSQLQANSVNSSVLASDNTTDSNRSVTTDHIRDGVVTRAKLSTTVGVTGGNGTPYLVAQGGSLPTSPVLGDEVYYEASNGTLPTTTKTQWHLRYNGTSWDFIGGAPLITFDTSSKTSGSINHTSQASTWFYNWATPSAPFQSLALPFAGTYAIDYTGVGGQSGSVDAAGTMGMAIAASTTGTSPITQSGAYCYFDQSAHDYVSVAKHMFYTVAPSASASNRYAQLVFRIHANADTGWSIYSTTLKITPITLTNWS